MSEADAKPVAGSDVAERLAASGHLLPSPLEPRGSYVNGRRDGDLVHLSGHTDRGAAGLQGQAPPGLDDDLEGARRAARIAAVNLVAAASTAVELDAIEAVVHLRGYVASTPAFTQHPRVVDAASELLHLAFKPEDAHTRAAIGVSSLPSGGIVELEAVLRVRSGV